MSLWWWWMKRYLNYLFFLAIIHLIRHPILYFRSLNQIFWISNLPTTRSCCLLCILGKQNEPPCCWCVERLVFGLAKHGDSFCFPKIHENNINEVVGLSNIQERWLRCQLKNIWNQMLYDEDDEWLAEKRGNLSVSFFHHHNNGISIDS